MIVKPSPRFRKRKHRGNVYFPITHQYHWSVINYANHSLNASVQFWIIGKGFEAEKIILPQHQNLDYQISIDVVPFEKLLADCKSLLM
ncbi:Uncharacterized protein APZ42_001036 [Daphnia magna]|uniref:Uncharacterized protein n=1 Tax=Daphnia magna TaxID=35525 RepID=A0A164J7N8_9CRUS|nr:Uncharacterized protein APZ42_001036 [Daphnia magna]